MVHGGEVHNVIPDSVTLQGTIRDLNPRVCDLIYERVRTIVKGVCDTYGATGTVQFDSMYACIDNHKDQAEADLPMPLLVPPEAAAEDKAGTAGLIQLPASK